MDENFTKIIDEKTEKEEIKVENENVINTLPEWSIEPPIEIDRNEENELS